MPERKSPGASLATESSTLDGKSEAWPRRAHDVAHEDGRPVPGAAILSIRKLSKKPASGPPHPFCNFALFRTEHVRIDGRRGNILVAKPFLN